jgi:hypothetical protein
MLSTKNNLFRKITALATMLVLAAAMAFATQTALTVIQLKQNNYAVQPGDLSVTFTACDATNGNSFFATGQEILLVQNTDTVTHTFTVSSAPDSLGREDTSLTGYSVPVSPGIVAVQMKYLTGWIQAGQLIDTTCSSNLLKFAVIRTN